MQHFCDFKIIEYSKSPKLKHNNNYFLFMQHLLFQNIINYFIIISMQEFRKITNVFYLQKPYSKNGSIINLYKFCVHSYDLLKEKLFCSSSSYKHLITLPIVQRFYVILYCGNYGKGKESSLLF